MENSRILSALCYFSVFFAPFLLPIIVFFITPDELVKHHAKRSLISHLIPIALGIFGAIGFSLLFAGVSYAGDAGYSGSGIGFAAGLPIIMVLLYGILSLVILIWNVVQGIKVLQE
ncbi:DUF4870 domain-containing protein [Paenisporosarcina cavernae]|uniref:DUF4870 domain-containing protein n=1 Tax=Paenisporosarcina cavernae TaxID=2320858 RepID=A0A385YYU0_9BACL|nr:DUF4870 domain-containing protein [Paenisporosarcina cavernae]AYC30828.1 DUF4870 domain-containing protein [Paenisporosarcina cavernae]